MDIKVKIYGCYELTYSKFLPDILSRLYPNVDQSNIVIEIEDISNNGKRSVQSQRSLAQYVTRTIRIYENDVLVHIVGMSNTNFDLDKQREKELDPTKKYIYGELAYHANTYLKQGCPAIFNYYFEQKEINPQVELAFYLLDIEQSYPHNLFNILSYRELQTIGFKVLNIDQITFDKYVETGCNLNSSSNISFSSFTKYMNDIALISKRNTGNIPSFLKCQEHLVQGEDNSESYYIDKYIYTFKALSAQGYDSLFRTWCMKVLADKEGTEIEFRLGKQYFHYDADEKSVADRLTGPILQTFKYAGIELEYVTNDEFMIERNLEESAYLSAKSRKDPRNQSLFRNNIRKKGVPTQCVICGNDNPTVLKAAHLWEVSAIKNADANTINSFIRVNSLFDLIDETSKHKGELFFKKYCLTNSGENGIWLCGNHHDLFDQNYFYFESEMGTVVLHFQDEHQAAMFLAETIADCRIPAQVLTHATKAFIAQRNICFRN